VSFLYIKGDIMTIQETKVEYITNSRTIHEINNSIAYYNYEGNHFRVFESFEDAKAFTNGEDVYIKEDFDSEEDLDVFLENTDICSVCGEICGPDDECYYDEETSDACCTICCFYDERDNVYRKGNELEFRLKEFAEGSECCPHCGGDYKQVENDEDFDCIIENYQCNECNKRWFKRYSFDKVGAGDSMHIITSEDEEMLASENKAMGDFLENQIGFSQEDVSTIANDSKQLYCVHVTCNNSLQHYSMYVTEDKAKEKYLELCKKWYAENGVENLRAVVEDLKLNDIQFYDGYYGSEEYYDACDGAHVAWEKLS
jgi:hypothetical protein